MCYATRILDASTEGLDNLKRYVGRMTARFKR
jgi:hypothetical protein